MGSDGVIRAELCGVSLEFDVESGGLIGLEYDGVRMLHASHETASLLDAAYPAYGFEPLRLGVCHSKGTRVIKAGDTIEIVWNALGMSRPFAPKGSVSAKVCLRPAGDGRSIVLTAYIDNRSEFAIPQVLFPDLCGLLPFAGEEGTELRTCGSVSKPFVDLKLSHDDGWWYACRYTWTEMQWGAYDKTMSARWMDLGSLKGGFSLFPKVWSWGELTDSETPVTGRVLLHLSQRDSTLRVMCEHQTTIEPGASWTSPEYVLTPHRHGWAKGIEPFRSWLHENVQRPHPLPSRLRETLGFRTVWLAEQYVGADPTPSSVAWRFTDLPVLARECREHGLNEMVLWLWGPWALPDLPSPELGTLEEFERAIAECRALGVNVSLFVSVMTLLGALADKYPVNGDKEFWCYHSDLVPMCRPYYGRASRGSFAIPSDPNWQADVAASLLKMVERGWTSICWDQAKHAPNEPNLVDIFSKVRAAASARDPEATFSAESLNNIDLDSRWLDYTWNWALFDEATDWRALVNAYPTPRFNVNIGSSPKAVKRLFADHLFMNVLPSKPDGINGSAHIVDYPALSRALKTCAKLHAQFREYFEDGVPVGDCVLSAPCPKARVNGYVLSGKALIVVLNTGDKACTVALECDMSPWFDGEPRACKVTPYDEDGVAGASRRKSGLMWRQRTRALEPNELALFEVAAILTRGI